MCKKIENHSLRRYRKKSDWQRGRGRRGWSGAGGGKEERTRKRKKKKTENRLQNF